MTCTENCIPEEAFPPRSGLLLMRPNDPHHDMSADEIQDRLEFIRCYLFRDFEVLLLIPKQERSNGFFIDDISAADPQYSAYNTVDFQRRRLPFNRYGYAMGKIMEHVKDLAIMHSCISDPIDQAAVKQRYENYLDLKFRDRLAVLIVQIQNSTSYDGRSVLKHKIAELNRRILEARKIWARYAPPEYWDR